MKECELCNHQARMYCESDQASLCWDCDAKVHGANFLVARHSRTLLCQNCQSPTPWSASGPKLGHTVSVCERCVNSCRGGRRQIAAEDENREDDEEEDSDDEDEDEDDDDEDDNSENDAEEIDGENQVVPWSPSPPPAASSSSSDDSSNLISLSLKRFRDNEDSGSQVDQNPSSIKPGTTAAEAVAAGGDDEATSFSNSRLKKSKLSRSARPGLERIEGESGSALIDSLTRFQPGRKYSGEENEDSTLTVVKICKVGKPNATVDLVGASSLNRSI